MLLLARRPLFSPRPGFAGNAPQFRREPQLQPQGLQLTVGVGVQRAGDTTGVPATGETAEAPTLILAPVSAKGWAEIVSCVVVAPPDGEMMEAMPCWLAAAVIPRLEAGQQQPRVQKFFGISAR